MFMFHKLALQILFLFRISQGFNVDILVSKSTRPDLGNFLLSSLSDSFQNNFAFILTSIEDCDFQVDCVHLPSIAIDATFNTFYSFQIRTYSEAVHFVYINLNQQAEIYGKYEFFSHISYENHYQALSGLLKYFDWKTFILISSNAVDPIFLSLKNEGQGLSVLCTDNEDQDIYDWIIGREVKPNGIGNVVLLNNGRSSPMIVKSLSTKTLLEYGYGVILGSESIWGQFINDGLVIYTEEGLEYAENYNHYEYLALKKIMRTILRVEDYNTEEIIKILEENTINHHPFPNFSIINTQKSQKIKVGEIINGIVSINSALIYPGNSTVIPNLPMASIKISLAEGSSDPPGNPPFIYLPFIRQGNHFAFRIAYQSGLLRNFNLKIQSTDCGASIYDASFSRPCFEALKENIGVVHLAAMNDGICLGDILDFRALGINVPIVSDGCGIVPQLMNKAVFPEFMTVLKEDSYTAGILPELAYIFSWKNVALIQRTDWAKASYGTVLTKLTNLHINIANNQSYYFSTVYTVDQYEYHKELFLDVINSKCRIVIALVDVYTLGNMIMTFYDLGMRKGDLIFLVHYRISISDFMLLLPNSIDKILELFQRSLTVNTAEWIGPYGEAMKNQLESVLHFSNYMGFAFDQTMLALNGIDYSINKGDNLENSTAVNANIRKQKFLGVTGTVSIEADSNSRSIFYINIFSILPIAVLNAKGDVVVGNYSISGAQRFLLNEIIWPGETYTTPSDMRISPIDCPFNYRLVQDSLSGKMIFLAIVGSFIIVEISLGIFQHKRWRAVKFENLKEPKNMKFGDILMMIILLVETLELISIGPDIRSYSIWVPKFIRLFSSDWAGPLDLNGDNFWIEVYISISLISFMVYSVYVIRKKYSENHSHYFFEINELISWIWILLLCTIAYIPLISILISVFLCKEGISDSITDSYVSHDCYTYCWSDFHLSISLLCLTILLVYITLVIYFQPSWQLYHPIFNILQHPKTAIYKSAIYFIMIGVNKNLHLVNKALEGMIYCFILIVLAAIYWKVRIYNYPRMNMWAIISIFIVIWSSAISSIYYIVDDNKFNFLWELGLVIGWSIIIFIGVLLQTVKFPNLLITEKGINMGVLFKFILGNKIGANEINELKMTPRGKGNVASNYNGSYVEEPLYITSKKLDSNLKNEENFAVPEWMPGT